MDTVFLVMIFSAGSSLMLTVYVQQEKMVPKAAMPLFVPKVALLHFHHKMFIPVRNTFTKKNNLCVAVRFEAELCYCVSRFNASSLCVRQNWRGAPLSTVGRLKIFQVPKTHTAYIRNTAGAPTTVKPVSRDVYINHMGGLVRKMLRSAFAEGPTRSLFQFRKEVERHGGG